MKILICYNGLLSSVRRRVEPLPVDIANLPTTHVGDVNVLLVAHWLAVLGHEVSVLVRGADNGSFHFPVVVANLADPADFDLLYLWQVHALYFAAETHLLERPWRHVGGWIDSPSTAPLGDLAQRIRAFAWATEAIRAVAAPNHPAADHVVIEHAPVFLEPPPLASAERGLYAGRLPAVYRDVVIEASKTAPILAYALWIEVDGEQIRLRPHQRTPDDLARARRGVSDAVDLRAGVNMIREAPNIHACFGLCPATGAGRPQVLSASKFWDYLALGLPVVVADNTPEAAHVVADARLGFLYDQGSAASLRDAIRRALAASRAEGFVERRLVIQAFAFANTWKHRAQAIHDQIERACA